MVPKHLALFTAFKWRYDDYHHRVTKARAVLACLDKFLSDSTPLVSVAYDEIIDEADWATWIIDGRGLGYKAREESCNLSVLFIYQSNLIRAVNKALHIGDMGGYYSLFFSPENGRIGLKEVSKAVT